MTYRVLSEGEPLPLQHHNFLDRTGIDIVWRGGDVIQPFWGNWFDPPFFRIVFKFYVPWRILPFIRWRFGRTVGYLGFKAFGVDSEHYCNWLPPDRVHVGSVAIVCSARMDADDH